MIGEHNKCYYLNLVKIEGRLFLRMYYKLIAQMTNGDFLTNDLS